MVVSNADDPRLRSRLPGPGRHHPARHRPPGHRRRGGRRRTGRALPHELRGGAKARRDPRTGRPSHQGAQRPPQGRPHQPRGAPPGATPTRPVRGAVARAARPDDRTRHRHEGDRFMTVTAVRKDPQALTMTIDAEFDAPPERVWQLWADPRQLERWWGPPTYPATFTTHDLAPGSRVEYHMTGPEGDQPHGYWDVVEVDPPRSLVFQDGFANDDGSPNPELPQTTARVTIDEIGSGRTRMSIESRFPSTEAMEQVLALGVEEGLKQAVGQIDAILAEDGGPGTAPPTTHTLEVPGVTLTYDVRRSDAGTEPVLLMIGSPMGAAGFGTLSKHFSDRTVVTYDPRGVERSPKADPASPVTPDVHADDLHRLIQAAGGEPVDLFGSSGGAVNALALVS